MIRIIFFLASVVAIGWTMQSAGATHGREWSFRVLLDDKEVGSQRFILEHTGGTTRLETQADIRVKFLFATVYRYSHRNVEIWNDGCLDEIDSSTEANRKSMAVSGQRRDGFFEVDSQDGEERLPECIMTFAYWNPDFLTQTELLNPQNGKFLPISISGPASDEHTVNGTLIPAVRYELSGENIDIRLWYTPTREWIALESTTKGGRTLRYELM